MYNQLRSLQYPVKLYVYLLLAVCSVISVLWIIHVQLPSGGRPYRFIWWNMLLAWIPMVLSLVVDVVYAANHRGSRTFLLIVSGALWLFFYPNTPYLLTDMLHVFARFPFEQGQRFWIEPVFWDHLLGMLLVALLGLGLGFISLESVRQLIRRSFGQAVSLLFVGIVLLLSSLGIYIGRFFRGNTWDIISAPSQLYGQVVSIGTDAVQRSHFMEFSGMMFVILLFSYLIMLSAVWLGSSRSRYREW